MKAMKSYSVVRSNPSHVKACIKRLQELAADAATIAGSIDPDAMPQDHAFLMEALRVFTEVAGNLPTPAKKSAAQDTEEVFALAAE